MTPDFFPADPNDDLCPCGCNDEPPADPDLCRPGAIDGVAANDD